MLAGRSDGFSWVLSMLLHCTHSRNRSTATDMETRSLLYFGCHFSGWYNFGKIITIVATRCHILMLKCTKFNLGWGSVALPQAL